MIKKNDVLKSRHTGNQRKVLAIADELYALSMPHDHDWFDKWATLSELERDYVIPEEEWEPENGDQYWYISNHGEIQSLVWINGRGEIEIKNFLGVYRTKSLAEQALAEIKRKLL